MDETGALVAFLDDRLGDLAATTVIPMVGGGSCEVFAVDRGEARWVLRRSPRHVSSATAHDVLREFRILDAIKDQPVRIPRPIVACDDPAVFGAPFYVMECIAGVPVRTDIPTSWTADPATQPVALLELIDALVEVHGVDWMSCGLGALSHPEYFLERQVQRWLTQLDSYGGRELPLAGELGSWLEAGRPPDPLPALLHGDYKLDNVLYADSSPPRLLAVVDWEMATVGDPLIDLAWALIFHPAGSTLPLGRGPTGFDVEHMPPAETLVERYHDRSGRDVGRLDWYHVFARWKLAIVLEGSYAKFVRGDSDRPAHQMMGPQVDRLLASAAALVEGSPA